MRRSTRSIFGVLVFALPSVCASAQQAEQFAPELQEFRKNGTRDPLRNIQVIRFGYLTELAEERGYIVVAPMGYNDHGGYGVRGAGAAGRGAC